METFKDYISAIEEGNKRERTKEVLTWVKDNFPQLDTRIAWNQPMFTHEGTFILGFSIAKGHLAVTPEPAGIREFTKEIEKAGYSQTKMLFRIPWDAEVDYELLKKMILFNLEEKKGYKTFWRK